MSTLNPDLLEDKAQELLQTLPLPLAQVLKRALNGKSVVERHHCTYYLAEAALKLAAAVRIGLWLSKGDVVGSGCAKTLQALALPSTGHWLSFLREVNKTLAAMPDAALIPLASEAAELTRKRPEWTGVQAFAEKLVQSEMVSQQLARESLAGGVMGFFTLVVAYRNDVIGHAAQRPNAFYDDIRPPLMAAICEVLSCPALFGGLDMAHARLEVNDRTGESSIVWQRLRGLGGVPVKGDASGAIAGRLYFVGPGAVVPLHPLAIYREDDQGREQVGILNGTVTKTRKTDEHGSSIVEVRKCEHLDYASSEKLAGVDARAALTELLSRLLGREIGKQDLAELENQTLAGAAQAPDEEATGAGAVIGDFELLGEIGRGAMSVVYKARQRSLGRIVALKVLPPSLASDAVTVKRFRKEIAVLARCEHPNIVKILSSGVDGDRYYYAMEYVEGTDLSHAFRILSQWKSSGAHLREGHLAAVASSIEESRSASSGETASLNNEVGDGLPEVDRLEAAPLPEISSGRDLYVRLAELFADAADGLQYLHDQGVVHRDIKPGNLMLTADGKRLVIMDLGLAKTTDQSENLTKTSVKILGTLRYMPPEQLQRRLLDVDHRADVYSLCATLYELATGHSFFDGDNEKRLIQQVLNEEPVPPKRVDRGLPRDLDAIIRFGASKLAKERYSTAAALAADLRAFASNMPIAAKPPGVIRRMVLWQRRHRSLSAVAATVLLILAVAGVWRWDYTRIKTSYYSAMADVWGAPVGVGRVSSNKLSHRNKTYKFSMQRGKVVRVELINGSGYPTANDKGESSWEMEYSADGSITGMIPESVSLHICIYKVSSR